MDTEIEVVQNIWACYAITHDKKPGEVSGPGLLTLLANRPCDTKKTLEFQFYLNFNYTWGSHRQNTVFQLMRPVIDKKDQQKIPPKLVILAKKNWPEMAPNISALQRNPRHKGLEGQRTIVLLLYWPSALQGLYAAGLKFCVGQL